MTFNALRMLFIYSHTSINSGSLLYKISKSMNIFKKNCRICFFVAGLVVFGLFFRTISWKVNISGGHEEVWVYQRIMSEGSRHLLGSTTNIGDDESVSASGESSNVYIKFNPSQGDVDVIGKERLRNTTLILNERLKELSKRLSLVKELESGSDFLDKPSKELAKVNLPEVPMVYESRRFMICGHRTLKLFILVLTEYSEKKERQLIRETWANFEKHALAAQLELSGEWRLWWGVRTTRR